MSDLTEQDRRDYAEVERVLTQMQRYVSNATGYNGHPAEWLRDLRAVFPAPAPTLSEELRELGSLLEEEGGAGAKSTCWARDLATRAEQIEQERDAARAEVARTDSARTQNYGDGSTLAGFLQKCVNTAHNIAAEYPSRPVKDHVIDLRWAADYAGRVEQERDEARSEVEHLTAELDQAIAQRNAETASREAAQKSRDEARAEVERLTTEQNTDLFGGAVYATPAGRMSQIQHYTFRPASALPDPAGVPYGQAWVVEYHGDTLPALRRLDHPGDWYLVRKNGTGGHVRSEDIRLVSCLMPAPRQITTREILDEAPRRTVIRDKDGVVCERASLGDGWYSPESTTDQTDYIKYPATVLWTPEVTK